MIKSKALPDLELLTELLLYNPENGVFYWKQNRGRMAKAGDKAGCVKGRYVHIRIMAKSYLAHRLAWFLYYKNDPNLQYIDHVNGNGIDNRICNLRLCTILENNYNKRKFKNNLSGYKGVTYDKQKNKWRASIKAGGKQIHLGRFDTPELAHAAYAKAAAELHGDFARAA